MSERRAASAASAPCPPRVRHVRRRVLQASQECLDRLESSLGGDGRLADRHGRRPEPPRCCAELLPASAVRFIRVMLIYRCRPVGAAARRTRLLSIRAPWRAVLRVWCGLCRFLASALAGRLSGVVRVV